jgi:hypothetical protein
MIDRDPFGDCVQQHRLSGASRGDDQGTLTVADGRDEVDRAPCQLRPTLRRTPRLEKQLAVRVGRGKRAEFRAASRERRILVIDLEQLDNGTASAVITARARDDRVATSEPILPDEMRCDVRVTGLREVAVRGSPNKATITRWVEPTLRLTVGDDWRWRLVLLVIALATAAPVAPTASPIAVELLVVLPASRAVLVPVAALFPVVGAMLAMLPRRSLVGTSLFTRSTLLLLSDLGR